MGEVDPILVVDPARPLSLKPPLTMELSVPAEDLAPDAPIMGEFEFPTPNLAVRRDALGAVQEVHVHANDRVRLKRGPRDLTAQHRPIRFLTIWEADVDMADHRVGPWAKASLSRGFSLDSLDQEPGHAWDDIPGIKYLAPETGRKLYLFEFLVSAQDDQRTWLYFIILLDIQQVRHRIRTSQGIDVTAPMVPAVDPRKPHAQPYRDEAATGSTAIGWLHDTGWLTYPPDTMRALPSPP